MWKNVAMPVTTKHYMWRRVGRSSDTERHPGIRQCTSPVKLAMDCTRSADLSVKILLLLHVKRLRLVNRTVVTREQE